MSRLVVTLRPRIVLPDGKSYQALARGSRRGDGFWEGWLEFVPEDGGPLLRTKRETTQPTVEDLEYWAGGLTPVYLEGALYRARPPARAASGR